MEPRVEKEPASERYGGNWLALALRAGAAIILGITAFVVPGVTLAAIVVLFGAYALTDGTLAVIAAVRGLRRKERWGAMMTEGVLGIAAGAIALLMPGIGALALVWLVAAWALATGAFELAAAMKLRREIKGEWLLLVGGILSIVLGLVLALRPGIGSLALIWSLGVYALVYGAINLGLAVKVRRWTQAHA